MDRRDSPAADKPELRRTFGRARRAMDDAQRTAARAAIRSLVLERCATEGWRVVAAYVPLRTEPGSVELLDSLTALGVSVLVPVTLADRDLDWAWRGPTGQSEALGLSAIERADAVLVPAMAVAADGTRLGRGGGSYDRALPRCRPEVLVAALLFDGELVDALPSDPWDCPVAAIVTPSGWTSL